MQNVTENIESNKFAVGAHAILGMDVVSFSTLAEETQVAVIQRLMGHVKNSLAFHELGEHDFRWSPAGDGGYITFVNPDAGRKAIDVAFSLFEKVGTTRGAKIDKFSIRAALHAGTVREEVDLGRDTNIWGMGINTTARILSVSEENQLLVSRQYFDTYIKDQRESEYAFGEPYARTVKHGVKVEVMNASKVGAPCLDCDDAGGKRWRYLGGLWRKTIEEYKCLLDDTWRAGDPMASIAAAKYLLDMGEEGPARELCKRLSQHSISGVDPEGNYPVERNIVFSSIPPDVLFDVVRSIVPRVVQPGEVICEQGVAAERCYFPVSGKIVLDIPGRQQPASVKKGHILGEFSLWIPNLKRTARIRSLDNGLILELGHQPLSLALQQYPEVATALSALIQRRITENVFLAPALFGGLESLVRERLTSLGAVCRKESAGAALDLSEKAYVLFIGKVRIHGVTGATLDIAAEGRFDALPVVGIYSGIGKPDGEVGEVIEESVVVEVRHSALRDLQQQSPAVARQWSGICGERLHEAKWNLSDLTRKASAQASAGT